MTGGDAGAGDAGAAAPGPVPLHRRTIEYEAYEVGDDLLVVGTLRDERPFAAGTEMVEHLHDMELRVTVRPTDLVITEATATMRRFPHAECPGIVAAFESLAGLSVARGYTREVQRRFGGPRGCTHLEHLARSLGPVVVQAVTSRRVLATSRGEAVDIISSTASPWARDSCHVWAEGGVAERKLAAGWRPGVGGYPSPPLEEIEGAGSPAV